MTTATLPTPGARRASPLRLLLDLRRDPLALFERTAREHGDVARLQVGPRSFVLLSHPDLVREVLVTKQRSFMKGPALRRTSVVLGNGLLTDEGESHLRRRRLLQPAFRTERVAGYAPAMAELVEAAVARWRPGEALDASAEMMRITFTIAGATLFGADVADEAGEVSEAVTALMGLFGLAALPLEQLLERLPFGPARRMAAARDRLDAVIARLIARGRQRGPADDFLGLLLSPEAGLSQTQIRDESLTFLLAGHETTAAALSWAMLLLARNPAVADRLAAEVAALGERPPAAITVDELPYAKAVLSEALRLYPPAWTIGREAVEAVSIAGHPIEAGTTALMSPWVIQRDGRFFPEPLRFLPERWLNGAQAERPRMAFFPFGGGIRICIGEGFALAEATLALALIARRWRLRLVLGQRLAPRPSVTLRPPTPLLVVPEARAALPASG